MFSQNKWGTRITPMLQWPDKSFTLGLSQALAWQTSGLMVRPTLQCRLGYAPSISLVVLIVFHYNNICWLHSSTVLRVYKRIFFLGVDTGVQNVLTTQ
jgi:hypothetical protein